jgi:hypothetical protein
MLVDVDNMNKHVSVSLLIIIGLTFCWCRAPLPGFRPPAVPIILHDPYINIWSFTDKLTDDWTRQWTGAIKAFVGLARIDGNVYRFMGPALKPNNNPPPMLQVSVNVYPMRTLYTFVAGGVKLSLEFTSPLFTDDFELSSRPVTTISYIFESIDGKPHQVQLYYDNSGEICVNTADQAIIWTRYNNVGGNYSLMSMGTSDQNILARSGDWIGIDWGYFYTGTQKMNGLSSIITDADKARSQFIETGVLTGNDSTKMPRPANDGWPVLAWAWNLGTVTRPVERLVFLMYDDLYSINWFGTWMRPYWRREPGTTAIDLFLEVVKQDESVYHRVIAFEEKLMRDLERVGGDQYATLAALAYRQVMAACKLVWNPDQQTPWYFLKEISSDGDLSTVDVIYPASPFFLYFNPQLLKLQLLPVFAYANNETSVPYGYPWAPHHLGIYPIGYILDSQQENMPIEETANLLLITAAVTLETNQAFFYPHYWPLLTQWANYLVDNLPDPGEQLCTDDFEGPIPHDANLAAKGIIGIGAYSILCKIIGKPAEEAKYMQVARQYVQKWLILANDTNHYRLVSALFYDNLIFVLRCSLTSLRC